MVGVGELFAGSADDLGRDEVQVDHGPDRRGIPHREACLHGGLWSWQMTQSLEEIEEVKELAIAALSNAIRHAFVTMVGVEAVVSPGIAHEAKAGSGKLVASLLGWIGTWNGTGILECSPEFACQLAGWLMGSESTELDEEALDCVAEFSNIIFGNMKTDLEDKVGKLGLSTPTVIYGENVGMRNIGEKFLMIVVQVEGFALRAKVSMAPVTSVESLLSHFWGGHYNLAGRG